MLTELEKELTEVLEFVLRCHTTKIHRREYMELMGAIRDGLKHSENVARGCSTGRHIVPCQCPPRSFSNADRPGAQYPLPPRSAPHS